MFLIDSDRVRACMIDPGRFLSEALFLGEDGRGRGAASVVRFMDIEYGCGAGWRKGLMSHIGGCGGVAGYSTCDSRSTLTQREVSSRGRGCVGWGGRPRYARDASFLSEWKPEVDLSMGRCSFDNRFTLTLLGEPTALALSRLGASSTRRETFA